MRAPNSILKVIPAALAVLLLTLGGFAIWSAMGSAHRAERTIESSEVGSAIAHLRDAMTAEIAILHGRHGMSRAELDTALEEKRALFAKSAARLAGTDGKPRRLLAVATSANERLQRDIAAVLAADTPSDGDALLRAAATRTKAAGEELHTAAHAEHDGHLAEMTTLAAMQLRLLFVTLIAFPSGIALIVLLAVAFHRSERRERERLSSAAGTDPLTGLGNRRSFEEDLAGFEASGEPLSMVLFDLDGLKTANDVLGHEAGDERLCALADAMRDAAGDRGRCHRTGGDEFAILLPGSTEWQAFRVARAVSDTLLGRAFAPHASTSGGIAEKRDGERVEEAVRRADLALLEAKRSRQRLICWSPTLMPSTIEQGLDPHDHHIKAMAAGLARAVDAKDPFTRSHCETVANLCEMLAHDLGLAEEVAPRLRLAGMLHDVGKIGVPDAILTKPGPLSDGEYAVMKQHTLMGWEIVAAAGLTAEARWIRHHHERVDGRGYPDALSGADIPLEALVIGAADAFEAMTAGRPYASKRSEAEALEELRRCAGTQFDPRVVDSLHRVLGARAESLA